MSGIIAIYALVNTIPTKFPFLTKGFFDNNMFDELDEAGVVLAYKLICFILIITSLVFTFPVVYLLTY
jgi:hypothetical protein